MVHSGAPEPPVNLDHYLISLEPLESSSSITYDILMRIHKDEEPIILCQSQHRDCVLNPDLIVYARPRRFNGFPCEDISNGIVTPSFQTGEVQMSILNGKWSAVEVDIVAIEEVLGNV